MCFVCMFPCECVCSWCVCALFFLCVSVCHHKRRLSWQLAALLGSWCAKFRLLLSNIQTHPNPSKPKSSARKGDLACAGCQLTHPPPLPLPITKTSIPPTSPHSVPRLPHSSFLAQQVLGSLHTVSCGCVWLWSQVNQGWRFGDLKNKECQRVLSFTLSKKKRLYSHTHSHSLWMEHIHASVRSAEKGKCPSFFPQIYFWDWNHGHTLTSTTSSALSDAMQKLQT